MSVQKAVEYINKVLSHYDEYMPKGSLFKEYLNKALGELKSNNYLEYVNAEKCECGKDSVCNIFSENGSKKYFCWNCFFKYSEEIK